MDIISNFAFNGIRCLVLISEENHAIDTTNVSNISVSLYGTNTNLPALSASGRYCLYILLIFNSVESSIQFLNRQKEICRIRIHYVLVYMKCHLFSTFHNYSLLVSRNESHMSKTHQIYRKFYSHYLLVLRSMSHVMHNRHPASQTWWYNSSVRVLFRNYFSVINYIWEGERLTTSASKCHLSYYLAFSEVLYN